MNRTAKVAIGGVAAFAAVWGVMTGYQRLYVRPLEVLASTRENLTEGISDREAESDQIPIIRRKLREFGATTLGSDEESVVAAMRTALNEICAHHSLVDSTVSTRSPEAVKSPAVKATDLGDKSAKALADFYVIGGGVQAVGSFEAVLRTFATIDAQPWVHRVEGWSIRPVDKSRERFQLSVSLVTFYFPDRDLRDPKISLAAGERVWKPVSDDRFASYRPILANAHFKEPVAPVETPQAVAAAPAPLPVIGPPYGDWKVTGVVRGRDGWELWLLNGRTGQRSTLSPGGKVLDVIFIDAAGEAATIDIGGTRFRVALGQTLADRQPTN